jgi:hypothetical protein
MTNGMPEALVLSVSPSSRGFAFVLFEAPLSPFDWGVKELRGPRKNLRIARFVESMIEQYSPLVLVLEDWTDDLCRRTERTRDLYERLVNVARKHLIRVVRISKAELHRAFAWVDPTTKYEIALAIAKYIPALSFQVPPVRKIWMSEDPRQSLYDAAALATAYYALAEPLGGP